ncbi:MAG TPA: TatD family hydrolase [Actinomycetota bacterium]|nr:TatD family hydrolase [Actinomycetota bacterium]
MTPASPDGVLSAVDTHCHLFLMEEKPEDVLRSAAEAGVDRLICVGIDVESSTRSVELARSFSGIFATAGVHPHTASEFDRNSRANLEALASASVVVGIGETGLDYYRELSPRGDQHRAFREHIAVSVDSGKPLVVHVREAWEDALRILEEERAEKVVLHCFSGDEALAKEATARGYFLSFAGNVTYPNAGALRDAAGAVTPDQILCETDSPFLAPQVVRGRANSPANLPFTLAALAEVRGVSVAEVAAATAAAAQSAFRLSP